MNNIYIVNDKYDSKVTLNFGNNTFIYNNNIYHFNFIEKAKIKIYNNETKKEEIYVTDDSYLFFINEDLKKYYKKIFLYHNEWNDQCIINLKTNYLKRINYPDQYGTFFFINNNLIIYIIDLQGFLTL